MKNTFLLQLFHALDPSEYGAASRFLQSPFFNRRADVQILFERLTEAQQNGTLAELQKETLFAAVYPGQPYHNLAFNHTFAYLAERLERYFALVEMQRDEPAGHFYRLRAFRRRGLTQLFERDAQLLEKKHRASPYRHAGWQLFRYQLENEIFRHRIVQRRGGPNNLAAVVDALGQFFVLENLRWACTAHALHSVGGEALRLPFADAVRREAQQVSAADNPALALLAQSLQALQNPDDEAAFQQLTDLLHDHAGLFPPAETRDLFMAAINFCIRRQNRGERAYAAQALALYQEALDRGVLLENGVLPSYTYNNIHMLAQVTGARDWARDFLDGYRDALAETEREAIFRYNLAIFHYRAGDYGQVLELLRDLEFSELFIRLDARRMLLKSYFERGEWLSLHSLLDSFAVFIRRQKGLGYHRESYRNLIRFTKKLAKRGTAPGLARQIAECPAVADREWLLEKAGRRF